MTGLSPFGPSNGCKLVLFADFRRFPHQIPAMLLHTNDMAEPAQPLDINMLHNVQAVEELIQLTVISKSEIIDNSH